MFLKISVIPTFQTITTAKVVRPEHPYGCPGSHWGDECGCVSLQIMEGSRFFFTRPHRRVILFLSFLFEKSLINVIIVNTLVFTILTFKILIIKFSLQGSYEI
jgi:hypothetical protein